MDRNIARRTGVIFPLSTLYLSQGTVTLDINPAYMIAGKYLDANNVSHALVRAPGGAFTTFDVPGAGTGPNQGTFPLSDKPAAAITGWAIDANNVYHGFLRTD